MSGRGGVRGGRAGTTTGTAGGRGSGGRGYGAARPTVSAAVSLAGEMEKKLTLLQGASTNYSRTSTRVVNVQSHHPPHSSTAPLIPSSSNHLAMQERPNFGTVGQKITVRTNHFAVQLSGRHLIHQYHVSITPEVHSKKTCRDIMNSLIDSYMVSHLGKMLPAYDGRESIYTVGPLPFVSKDFPVKLLYKDQPTRKEREFKVAIKFAAKVDPYHLHQFLQRKKRDLPQETLQALDIVLRSTPSVNYTVIGRSFFSPSLGQKGTLGDGLEYWLGFYQSLRPTQFGLSLNIDISAKTFFDPIPVTEFIQKHFHIRDLSRPLSDQDCIKIKKALRGVNVQMTHLVKVQRRKIASLSQQPLNQLMFMPDDINAKRMSVDQYYLQRYKVTLRYPSLPAIQIGSNSKPIYLPMELCKIVEGQRYSKKLNEKQVTNLLRATCQRPKLREQSIRQVALNNYHTDELVNEFGIHINPQPSKVQARVLPPPLLIYNGSQEAPRMGQWNMTGKKLFDGATIDYWACVNFSRLNEDQVGQFCSKLVQTCESKGMKFNEKPLIPFQSAKSICNIGDALASIHSQCKEQLLKMKQNGKHLQLLIAILPDNNKAHHTIKRICETELGIVSQCCLSNQVVRMTKSYFENIALKINIKGGGRNTVLASAVERKLHFVSDRPTIIFGADVTHPISGEDSSSSIAAVVASMDWPEVTKYRGLVSAQGHGEEIICDLFKEVEDPEKGKLPSGMIREHLIAFRNSTGYKPDRIIFFRDGVGEGQFSQVLLYEVDAIRKACWSLEENYQPRITFVVVMKRHHTRLFPMENDGKNSSYRSGNVLPGTVVDTQICHPSEFDFFLCSHSSNQGTSRPAHYQVLYDENGFSADAMQGLTNNLCYTYASCPRSISIATPPYYAHLAALRARCYVEEGDAGNVVSTNDGLGGGNTRDGVPVVRPLPNIMDNIKDLMFYC